MRKTLLRLAEVFFLIVGWLPGVLAQQTDNHILVAVPAPGSVRIDGDLGDWDLSGTIEACYDVAKLRKRYSVRVAAMYDHSAFYLSFRFRDPTPMENWVNPDLDPQGGWRGDAVQVRFQTDQIVHLTSWYDTQRKRPWASLHYGMWEEDSRARDLNDARSAGLQVAFRKASGGQGYVQELAIPWKLLTQSGVAPAHSFRCGMEFFWGGPKGSSWPQHHYADLIDAQNPQRSFLWEAPQTWGRIELVRQGNLAPVSGVTGEGNPRTESAPGRFSTRGSVPIVYKLPSEGFVTLVIEDEKGRRVRNLIADYPRKAGWNQDFWDGRDDWGNALPPGNYTVRGLYHGPFHLEYVFAYGNPGVPPWITLDGHGGWLSNHENPMFVASDRNRIYVAAAMAEGACALMALDQDGRKCWGVGGIAGGPVARMGRYLYMVVGGALSASIAGIPAGEIRLVRYNPNNGDPVPFGDGSFFRVIGRFNPQKAPPPRNPEGEAIEQGGLGPAWCQRQTMGLAGCGNRLYVSLYFEDKVLVVDGEGKILGEIPLERPSGLATASNGDLLAISDRHLVRIDAAGRITPVSVSGLSAPIGLATGPDASIYVSDWGREMNVKVFDHTGRLLRTIGQTGGRPLVGPYKPDGMFRPWGLAVDGLDRLWVAEWDSSPRRISVWNRRGQLLREFCGTTYYAAMGCAIDSFFPTRGFVTGNMVDLDWRRGLWRVAGTPWRPQHADDLFGPAPDGISRFLRKGSEIFWINGTHDFVSVSRLEPSGLARPLVALGDVSIFLRGNEALPRLIREGLFSNRDDVQWAMTRFPSVFLGVGWQRASRLDAYWWVMRREAAARGRPLRHTFLWVDQNGDGRVQAEEIVFFSKEERGGPDFRSGWLPAVASDFSIGWVAETEGMMTVWRIPCSGWSAVGAPVYRLEDARRVLVDRRRPVPDAASCWFDSRGNLLVNHDPLEMISPDGKVLWQYPNPWPGVHGSVTAPQSHPGRLIGPLYVLGSADVGPEVGEVFCLSGNMGERYLFTVDGLFVAALFHDCRAAPDSLPSRIIRGARLDGTTAGGEPFGGQFFRNPIDGAYYLCGPVSEARECCVISQVKGLESIHRLPSQPLYLSQSFLGAGSSNTEEAARPRLSIIPLKESAGGIPSQRLFNWSSPTRTAQWAFDPRHSALAAWTFDDRFLYLGFQSVKDPTPMINRGNDPTRLFKTGDCAVFELGRGRSGPMSTVLEGDFRLVLSVYQGKPIAVVYCYREAGTKEPVEFASPIGVTRIDRVQMIRQARIELERDVDGYSLYAALPLAALGLHLTPGSVYWGDFGIIYSDPTGTSDRLRMFWANRRTGIVSDVATEASIDPAQWGLFEIQR
ncbi:FlgD immunoglobulin-like domain containing protein [Candidatus Methylacidithermus pantelleriae]|uniref:Uncharacterized protein n=1 Tax=Candidatus Methylacidithermus pantelleriae TaxID=2744239 RepID=A0A8J2BLS8_9BACT|nr:FlgD immunoglobulin-like domain containing protein [Candidatus Methylacidithermus pantelleriae]CAF0694318.1 conserved hypothetical protein [Candidatus Methylacidithermus pantelleriae]